MTYPFRNLIFEGGGVKGIAYLGALITLEEKGIMPQIRRVGGTSAGAINAVLLGLGYDRAETEEVLTELDFNDFMDDDKGLVRDSERLLRDYGWFKGDFFHEWIGELIRKKAGHADATFDDLHRQGSLDLYFIATNLSTHLAEVFSCEHTPHTRVADAVRMSMSLPVFFASVADDLGHRYVDGGMLNNYPIKLFDRSRYIEPKDRAAHGPVPEYYKRQNGALLGASDSSPYVYNRETLGFRLDSKDEISMFRDGRPPVAKQIGNFVQYARALVETLLEAQGNDHLHSDDWQRTVYIDTLGIKTTDFDLDGEKKLSLIESGLIYSRKYFQWYDDPASAPANRP